MIPEAEIQEMLEWIDKVPLSRPKRNFSRDFSDGVLAAEVVKFYYPKLVDMHNYPSANSNQQKIMNWRMLNNKVLKKLGTKLSDSIIEGSAASSMGFAEQAMVIIMHKIKTITQQQPEVDIDEGPDDLPRDLDYEHTIEMLQAKILKLEQLIILKDKKLQQLMGHS